MDELKTKEKVVEQSIAEMSREISGETSQSTISDNTVSATEAAAIRAEVREIMRQRFAAGRGGLGTNPNTPKCQAQPEPYIGQVQSDKAAPSPSVIDLMTNSSNRVGQSSATPIAGSEVFVASATSPAEGGGNASHFSRLSQQSLATSPPQMFATTRWKPKEPPCFFGRSTADVHT